MPLPDNPSEGRRDRQAAFHAHFFDIKQASLSTPIFDPSARVEIIHTKLICLIQLICRHRWQERVSIKEYKVEADVNALSSLLLQQETRYGMAYDSLARRTS